MEPSLSCCPHRALCINLQASQRHACHPSLPAPQSLKFPPEFSTKVDLTKVNWDTLKPWIAKRITELLGGLEDEVLIAYVYEQLDGKKVGALLHGHGTQEPGTASQAGRDGVYCIAPHHAPCPALAEHTPLLPCRR